LHYAVGKTECLKAFINSDLKNKKDVLDQKNSCGNTALHLAADQGQQAVITLLCEAKADVNVTNQNGDTAAILAVFAGHLDCLKALYDADPRVINKKTADGRTLLHLAAEKNQPGIITWLISITTNTNTLNNKNATGNTALDIAITNEATNVVEILINAGAVVDKKTRDLAQKNGTSGKLNSLIEKKQAADKRLANAAAHELFSTKDNSKSKKKKKEKKTTDSTSSTTMSAGSNTSTTSMPDVEAESESEDDETFVDAVATTNLGGNSAPNLPGNKKNSPSDTKLSDTELFRKIQQTIIKFSNTILYNISASKITFKLDDGDCKHLTTLIQKKEGNYKDTGFISLRNYIEGLTKTIHFKDNTTSYTHFTLALPKNIAFIFNEIIKLILPPPVVTTKPATVPTTNSNKPQQANNADKPTPSLATPVAAEPASSPLPPAAASSPVSINSTEESTQSMSANSGQSASPSASDSNSSSSTDSINMKKIQDKEMSDLETRTSTNMFSFHAPKPPLHSAETMNSANQLELRPIRPINGGKTLLARREEKKRNFKDLNKSSLSASAPVFQPGLQNGLAPTRAELPPGLKPPSQKK